jgi:hypothetical protein
MHRIFSAGALDHHSRGNSSTLCRFHRLETHGAARDALSGLHE